MSFELSTKLFNGQKIKKGDRVKWIDSDGIVRIDIVDRYKGKLFICNNGFPPKAYRNAEKMEKSHE